jgi:hypothetical protein
MWNLRDKSIFMKVHIHEESPLVEVHDLDHLKRIILDAGKWAKERDLLSLISLVAPNDNTLDLVIGGYETVLRFNYGHQSPPYYASLGKFNSDEPVMTCYFLFKHHTEFRRKHIMELTDGLNAVYEFYDTNDLPKCIVWMEV